MCTKSQKDRQNLKNTGFGQAFFLKCPSRRANLSLDGRLLYTALHLRALSQGVFPSSSFKSGLALCLKGFKLRCLQFYLGQNFQDYYLIMTRSMAGRPIQAALTLVNIRAFVKEELHHLPAVPGCTQLYQAVPGCTRQYEAVP